MVAHVVEGYVPHMGLLTRNLGKSMTLFEVVQVARALVEFETLWHQAWIKYIDQSKAGLQATLLVRHPDTGALLVNFDKEIMQLIRETKYLRRIDVYVPESAKMVLLQV